MLPTRNAVADVIGSPTALATPAVTVVATPSRTTRTTTPPCASTDEGVHHGLRVEALSRCLADGAPDDQRHLGQQTGRSGDANQCRSDRVHSTPRHSQDLFDPSLRVVPGHSPAPTGRRPHERRRTASAASKTWLHSCRSASPTTAVRWPPAHRCYHELPAIRVHVLVSLPLQPAVCRLSRGLTFTSTGCDPAAIRLRVSRHRTNWSGCTVQLGGGSCARSDGVGRRRLDRSAAAYRANAARRPGVSLGARVLVDVLEEALWAGSPPPSARKTLQVHIVRLRRARWCVGDRRASRWLLARSRRRRGRRRTSRHHRRRGAGSDPRRRRGSSSRLVRCASAAFYGEPYEGVSEVALPAGEAARLQELRATVVEETLEAELACGRGQHTSASSKRSCKPTRIESGRGHCLCELFTRGDGLLTPWPPMAASECCSLPNWGSNRDRRCAKSKGRS